LNGKEMIRLLGQKNVLESVYERVFEGASQEAIYEFVREPVEKLIEGFNCTVFAYG
jgi:hypothetical protein